MGLSGPRPPLTSLNSINSAEIVPQDPEANSQLAVSLTRAQPRLPQSPRNLGRPPPPL